MEYLELYNNFINSSRNISEDEILREIYDNREDMYSKEKMKLWKEDFGKYWNGLDKNNKRKYTKMLGKEEEEIEYYDKIIKYDYNTTTEELIENLYEGRYEKSEEKKINALRKNIYKYWKRIDDNEKIKYIELAIKKDENE